MGYVLFFFKGWRDICFCFAYVFFRFQGVECCEMTKTKMFPITWLASFANIANSSYLDHLAVYHYYFLAFVDLS